MPILPESQTFDQRTMGLLLSHDAVVQGYRALFAPRELQRGARAPA